MSKTSSFNWSADFNDFIRCMTWGNNYGGEAYWQEEEGWIRQYFKDKNINTTLNIAFGLFRELDTLKSITHEKLTGVEYERKFVDYVKNQNPGKSEPEVEILQGDAQNLEFKNNIFDLTLILFNSMIPDMNKLLKEMRRVTKPDGYVVLSFWKDDQQTTEYRIRTYQNGKDFRTGEIIFNPNLGINDLVMKDYGKKIYLSAIYTKEYIINLINKNIPNAKIEFFDREYCRMVVIR